MRDPEEGRGRRGMEPVEGKMARTSDLGSVSTRLHRIAELARKAPEMVIVTLAHHIDLAWMYEAYRQTRKDGAAGSDEVTAGELKTRGYYQGSNVSYNLKKLVEMGYMHHQRCDIDRRSVRVRLTERGREIRDVVAELFERHASTLETSGFLGEAGISPINATLKRLERFWGDAPREPPVPPR